MRKIMNVLLLLSVIIPYTATNAQQAPRFAYAYYSIVSDGQVGQSRLLLIDPAMPEKEAQQVQLDLPPETRYVQEVYASPDGAWVAYLAKDRTILRVKNLLTDDSREIDRGYVISVAWAPNSDFIAVMMGEGETYTVFVYSLKTQEFKKISSELSVFRRFAWSPESRYLVVTKEYCFDVPNCDLWLSAYDVQSGEKIAQADISYLFGGRAGNLICELNWSPNSKVVSFNSGCDLGTERTLKEVYVWQLAIGDVKRITNFTVDILKDERVPTVAARYKTWWLDNNTLLISGAAWTDLSGPESNFTAKYVLRDATLQLISQVGSAQWAVNPVNGKVAYVTAEATDITESLSANSKVVVSTVVADTLKLERAFNGGCKAVWSPDGSQLVVLTYTTLSCLAGLKGIVFIDPDTGSQRYHEIALDRNVMTDFAQPVGWARVR